MPHKHEFEAWKCRLSNEEYQKIYDELYARLKQVKFTRPVGYQGTTGQELYINPFMKFPATITKNQPQNSLA